MPSPKPPDSSSPKSGKKVEPYNYPGDSRTNIPTAETERFVSDSVADARPVKYPRLHQSEGYDTAHPERNPQLVWDGKKQEDENPLTVDAHPIYIQEKINPAAIIKDLQQLTATNRPQDQSMLFDDFDHLSSDDPNARFQFYQHSANWSNRMILGDSLQVMASLAEREDLRGRIQCVFFDPPYGIKFNSNWQYTTKSRDVKDTQQHTSREPEVIRAFRDTWKHGIHSFLPYLRDRLTAAHDLLADTGSIFVQIGDSNVHRVRCLLDEVFGSENFINEIILKKKSSTTATASVNDFVLWYAKDRSRVKIRQIYRTDPAQHNYDAPSDPTFNELALIDGTFIKPKTTTDAIEVKENHPTARWGTRNWPIVSQDPSATRSAPYSFQGQERFCGATRHWSYGLRNGLPRLEKAGRLHAPPQGKSLRGIMYWDERLPPSFNNIWDDLHGEAKPDYVVQTSWKAVERCILQTTDPGDLVLDPTCGSGTTAFVAEKWGRRWITIDTSRVALTLARARMMAAQYDYYMLCRSKTGAQEEATLTGLPPISDDELDKDVKGGFVYKRQRVVSLKSIAHNAEIDLIWNRWEENKLRTLRQQLSTTLQQDYQHDWQIPSYPSDNWSDTAKSQHKEWQNACRDRQQEIDDSNTRNAELVPLHDSPRKEPGIVRTTGPFTVESLSPHRILPVEPEEQPTEHPKQASDDHAHFVKIVMDNLKQAPIHNTKKGGGLKLSVLKPWVDYREDSAIHLEGRYGENSEKRVAVFIGPEYGTVTRAMIVDAARQAVDMFAMLIVCGFAFEATTNPEDITTGPLRVQRVYLNQDLRMADRLRTTQSASGNLFAMFGEPDIKLFEAEDDDHWQVEIRGIDIFDPATGDVGSHEAEDIACWFMDTDYNEESFFVRHAYFPGDSKRYDDLRKALKSEIDADSWETLHKVKSRPFPTPESGKIAVKAIDCHGNEVLKILKIKQKQR